MQQSTDEWIQARLGFCTASRFDCVLARLKGGGEAATRRAYRVQLACERLTGYPQPEYNNEAMRWGNDQEPYGRIAFEAHSGELVEQVGFIEHPQFPHVGASPDGLVGDHGLIELKCPYSSAVHLETLENGMPPEHKPQLQGQLWVTQRQFCMFCSYDPRMPGNLSLYVQRIELDSDYVTQLALEIIRFNDEVDAMVQRLLQRAA